jgi:hypothetical protein
MNEIEGGGQNPAGHIINLVFPHAWQAEILRSRPAILPARHFVYPRDAEEIERGALEILIRPHSAADHRLFSPAQTLLNRQTASGHDFSRAEKPTHKRDVAPAPSQNPVPQTGAFLATCALGFRDPVVPTGLWSCPNPNELLAVAGGYAYLIDTRAPERSTMIPWRPVLEVHALPEAGLLLFVGHHAILAWGREGQAWQSDKLSDEGVTITSIDAGTLHGTGWKMMTDSETPFSIDLKSGQRRVI